MQNALAILAAYLLGSVPFAMISSKVFGLADPRTYGSAIPAPPTYCAAATRRQR